MDCLTSRLAQSQFCRLVLCLTAMLVVPRYSARAQIGSAAAQNPTANEVTTLAAGVPLEREIAGGASHTYNIALTAGEFIDVLVNQQGADIVLTWHGPDEKPLAESDGPNAMHGPERVAHIAETTGAYKIRVRSYRDTAPLGRYQIKIEALRQPDARDRTRVDAQSRLIEGQQYWAKLTADAALEALPKFQESLALWRSIGDRLGEADALWYVADAYRLMNEPRKAIETRQEELVLRRALADVRLEAVAFINSGADYRLLGDYQKAMEYQTQALRLARTIENYEELGSALQRMGQLYVRLGDRRRALEYFESALSDNRAHGFRDNEADVLWDIGTVHDQLGEHREALSFFTQALDITKTLKSPRSVRQQATTLAAMGRVYRALGDADKAIEHFEQSIVLSRKVGWRYAEATTLTDLGGTYASLGQTDKAQDAFAQALAIQRAIRDREFEAVTLTRMAGTENRRGNLTTARQHLEAALDIVDSHRSNVTQEALRATYRASKDEPFEMYVDVLMQLHAQQPSGPEAARAFEASERWRARSLLEILTEANADIRQGVDADLLERERRLQERINTTAERQVQLLSAQRTQPADVAGKELDALVSEFRQVQGEIRTRSPRYASLTQPLLLNVPDIQRELLDQESLLLEYSLGTERSYLWAVTPASFTSHVLPKRAEIETLARRLYQLLTARNEYPAGESPQQRTARLDQAGRDFQQVAAELSEMLLGPVASELSTKRLIVVGDGALQYIPFSALPTPRATGISRPLIIDREVVTLPSASVLHVLRRELGQRPPASKAVAILADPVFSPEDPRLQRNRPNAPQMNAQRGLPGDDASASEVQRSARESGVPVFNRLRFSRQEAEAVAALAPANRSLTATDFAASKATATSPELGGYRIVHFATHGLINNNNPELSGIVLSLVDEAGRPQDGFLRMHDIYNLRLGADLVVLSACRTALGKEIKGEGLVGLTRGFMYAGAPRVVASLWNVDDRATAELMKQLYVGVLKEGQPPSAALRAAQVAMWKARRWQSPYYWAAFVMQGEWR
jgi:CHAT domain-containing protein/Tfp pilus assembly protein PilF